MATSTTWRSLRGHRRILVVGTVVALACCLTVFLGVQRAADAAAGQSVPSILAVYDAQVALRTAHGAALANFSGDVRLLGGPGEEYQNQIAAAGQHLAEVAERNAAGDAGRGEIQVVEALLVTYTGLISQAHVHFRDDDTSALGAATLVDAATLLEELLLRLDRLREAQVGALAQQDARVWNHPLAALLWLSPLAGLVVALVRAQRFLRHRFRRRLNAPLLLATVFVVVMGAATATSLWSASQLTGVTESVRMLQEHRRHQLTLLAVEDARRLTERLKVACAPAGCPRTIARVAGVDTVPPQSPGAGVDAVPPRPGASAVEPATHARVSSELAVDRAARAATGFGGEVVIPVAALCVLVAVLLGFQPRIEEYRYHER